MFRHATLLLLILALPAAAHEMHYTIEATNAVAIRLTYPDGKPFTFQAFEATPEGKDVPTQTGRTDEQGRAVFAPGDVKRWRVKAFSADGHGVDLRFETPAVATIQAAAPVASGDGPNRASLLLFGFSLLLGGFSIYQIWLRNKK